MIKKYTISSLIKKRKYQYNRTNYSYQELFYIAENFVDYCSLDKVFFQKDISRENLLDLLIISRYKNNDTKRNRNYAEKRIDKFYKKSIYFRVLKNNQVKLSARFFYELSTTIIKNFEKEILKDVKNLPHKYKYLKKLNIFNIKIGSIKTLFEDYSPTELLYISDVERQKQLNRFFTIKKSIENDFISAEYKSKYFDFGVKTKYENDTLIVEYTQPCNYQKYIYIEEASKVGFLLNETLGAKNIKSSNKVYYSALSTLILKYNFKSNSISLKSYTENIKEEYASNDSFYGKKEDRLISSFNNFSKNYSIYLTVNSFRIYIDNNTFYLNPKYMEYNYTRIRFDEDNVFSGSEILNLIYRQLLTENFADFLLNDETIIKTSLDVTYKNLGKFNNKRDLYTAISGFEVSKRESKLTALLFITYINSLVYIPQGQRDVFFNFINSLVYIKDYNVGLSNEDLLFLFYKKKTNIELDLVRDYINICIQLNHNVNLNIKSQKRMEDLHIELSKKINNISFSPSKFFLKLKTPFTLIKTSKKLQKEAVEQRNCVNSYAGKIKSGKLSIYSYKIDDKRITLALGNNNNYNVHLIEAKYKYNKSLSKEHLMKIKNSIKNINLELRKATKNKNLLVA